MIKRFFYRLLLVYSLSLCLLPLAAQKTFTLVIDAGHGGKDFGAPGSFSYEKDINLKVALAFGKLVEKNCPDVKVIYTRKTDVFIPLDTRADIANRAKAQLFISIHTNSLPNGRIAYGSETYTLGMHRAAENLEVAKRENNVITYENDYKTRYKGFDPNRPESYVIFEFMQDKFMKESVELARAIQKHYTKNHREDRSVRQAGFLVLRKTSMPSILTELGFISTPSEERYLNSPQGIQTLAASIYNGFIDYRNKRGYKGQHIVPQQPDTTSVRTIVQDTQNAMPATTDLQKDSDVIKAVSVNNKSTKTKVITTNNSVSKTKKTEQKSTSQPLSEKHYRIQFTMSPILFKENDSRLKGIHPIKYYKDGNNYKYTTGIFKTLTEARKSLKDIQQLFPDAFIVTFMGEERIR